MNIIVNIKELVRQYLPPHKRRKNRLEWLTSLLDLQGVFEEFEAWKKDLRYKVRVTSQHMILESHLKKVFGERITIVNYSERYLEVGLNGEIEYWVSFESAQPIALKGESQEIFDDVDFVVYAPPIVNRDLLSAEIEKYKLADRTYKII